MFISFKAVAQGASHKEIDKLCQDSALCYPVRVKQPFGIVGVADGHGGEKYLRSKIGSEEAIRRARKAVPIVFLENRAKILDKESDSIEKALHELESDIISTWRRAVLTHVKEHLLNEKEQTFCEKHHFDTAIGEKAVMLYGTTLLAALVSDNFWFAIQIGDGLCVLLDEEGKPTVAIPEDERLAFGRTTSLCDSNAHKNFRHNFGFGKIQGITVCTDGVADSFEPDKYLAFNQKLRQEFLANPKIADTELQKFLPKLSERGSRDDVAIAGVWRVET